VRGAGERGVAVGLRDAPLLGLQPRQAERGLVGERRGDQDLVRRPGGGRPVAEDRDVADVARPGDRDQQRGGRVDPPGQLDAELRRDPLGLQRQRGGGARDVRDRRCAGLGGADDLDDVDGQRTARLGLEQGDQLGVAAGRERSLGEAAQWSVRDMRSGCRRRSQGSSSLRPKGLRIPIGPGEAALDARTCRC
jgi:hypothetical protein